MKLFNRISILVLFLSFSVILAGSVVRMTGSGMGCPDWPKCFGQYIPPTDISQLPPNYKILFAVQGKEIADFDAFKTWVEYINRLLGAILGLAIIVLTAISIRLFKIDKVLALLSAALLVVTGFVGWLGSVVVATDLEPVKITFHMLSSVVIIGLAVTLTFRSNHLTMDTVEENNHSRVVLPSFLPYIIVISLVFTILQIILGTQVREQIDIIAKQLEGRWRERWIEQLDSIFLVHRSMSWGIVITFGVYVWSLLKNIGLRNDRNSIQFRRLIMGLCTVIVFEIGLGVTMNYFAIPKAAQPLHLLSAMIIFAMQWWCLLLHGNFSRIEKKSP
ncbi:MAG: COX15/CtaA family protein [Candidatus Kapabacteria bacterium]|jgi:cytochrome c oxidase assembly protein subunit 15|nr:COX15/CtaA family protein [Candidatus Kapabacteria bacterium]